MTFNKEKTCFYDRYPKLIENRKDIEAAADSIIKCYENSGKILICGNGGSAADCEHIVGELMKGFNKKRELKDEQKRAFDGIENAEYLFSHLQNALPAVSLVSQTSLITAFLNDVSADMIFAQQVWGYGNKGDILLSLSTSGNSANVVNASKTAKAAGLTVISVTGEKESGLSLISDICIRLPACSVPEIQELTVPVYHYICDCVESRFFEI